MKIVLFLSLGIMVTLFIISGIIPSMPVWAGGIIGIIVFLGAGYLSAKLMV